jgi:hypothetical protein
MRAIDVAKEWNDHAEKMSMKVLIDINGETFVKVERQYMRSSLC